MPVTSSSLRSGFRQRLPVLSAIVLLVGVLVWGRLHFGHLYQMWLLLGIPALPQPFGDALFMTHAINAVLHGANPYVNGSFDPYHRLYNYPPLWLGLRFLGIRASSTNLLGCIFALSGLAACAALFRSATRSTGIISFLAVFSWPLLFGIERGNSCLLILGLLVFGVLLIGPARTRSRTLLRAALIVLLTVLKIYPIAASLALVRRRRFVLACLTVVISAAALLLTCGRDLHYVFANTPEVTETSFGSFTFLVALGSHLSASLAQAVSGHKTLASLFALILGSAAIAFGALWHARLHTFLPEIDLAAPRGFLALAGLAMYCLIFARGANYDYWLIFLFPVLAWLLEDLNRQIPHSALPAALVLLAFLWSPVLHHRSLQEPLDLLVFIASCAWLGATMRTALQPISNLRPGPLHAEITPASS